FCNQSLITESASPPSPAEVGEQLNTFFQSRKRVLAKQRQIAFYGGSFTGMEESLQEAYLEVAQPYLRQGLVDSIRISTRPDDLSAKQLAFLVKRGVRTIELGIQSLSDTVLQASRRGYTTEQALEGIYQVQHMGLEVGAQIMIGLPGDTGSESLETVEMLSELKPDFVRIYPLLIFSMTD
ncbi:MAG: radical SAM protein, partial [Proteobacteria bacterium]|nr:radical SAM protein [Pseudomonadota bacterium]